MRTEATLKIDLLNRSNPACSLCGTEFGSEGMVRSLIDAFVIHVRRQHVLASTGYIPRERLNRQTLRTARRP